MRACSTQALAEARDTAAHAITQERKHIERRNVVAIFAMDGGALGGCCDRARLWRFGHRYPHQHRSAVRSGERKRYRGCARHPPAARRVRHHLGRGACYCRRGAAECARKPARLSFHGGHLTGRGFGATFAILMVVPAITGSSASVNMGMTALFAFAGAMISSLVVLAFSRLGLLRPESIILVGVALSALFAGASTIIQYFADDVELTKVMFWQFGDLSRATWSQMGFMFVVGLVCTVYFIFNRWNYNALQNGGHVAGGLGVSVDRVRVLGVLFASIMAAAMVSFVGLINFIGLIAPHIARRFIGNDYRYLLPASLVLGAIIMLASDLVARMIISPIILPIGAITSFLGAPLFLYLLYRGYRRQA